jgi:tRNA (guanine-N7-)-methyltransferase
MARGRHPSRMHIDPPDEQTGAKYLFRWCGRELRRETQRFPGLTSAELFGNSRPLEIDFGCGTGVLACGRAKQNPGTNMLGIDQSQKPLYCAIAAAAADGLENIKFVRGNFSAMLPLLRPQTVSAAYYLFPNPPGDYGRERSNLRRREFFQCVHASLVPGGRLHFATDDLSFFDCAEGIVKNDLCYKTLDPETADCDFVTRYRRLWEEKGRCVRSLVVEKEG